MWSLVMTSQTCYKTSEMHPRLVFDSLSVTTESYCLLSSMQLSRSLCEQQFAATLARSGCCTADPVKSARCLFRAQSYLGALIQGSAIGY